MRVEPNQAVGQRQEMVLLEKNELVLFDGTHVLSDQLGAADSPFMAFLKTLDPNLVFISAVIPDDQDRPVFFAARTISHANGIHMQATVDTAEAHRRNWENYCRMKRTARAEDES